MDFIESIATSSHISCAKAFELISRGAISDRSARSLKSKWKHVKSDYRVRDRICPYCGFLSLGYTDIEQLQLGLDAGRQCCSLILEAVRAWIQHGTKSLDEMHIFAWQSWHAGGGEELVGCSILLYWPDEEDRIPKRLSKQKIINIFKSGPINEPTAFTSSIPFMEGSRPSEDTGSEQAMSTIESWIGGCNSNEHRYCTVNGKFRLPKRILELTEAGFRLREGLDNQEIYACLSHCWGAKGPSFTLTKDTIDMLKTGMLSTQLPRTFQEAAEICLRLGIRYLWIDALCIIQQDVDDWKEAAASMAEIYENAFVTIAATASSDSEGGCFSRMKGFDRATRLESGLYACNRAKEYLPENSYAWLSRTGPSPLLRRAWVFQERLLSPRVVHFTETQLMWECRSTQQSETGDINDNWTEPDWHSRLERQSHGRVEYPFKYPYENTGHNWQRVVSQYSHLELTHASDRLPAIAAIVQRTMRARKHDTYIAGMWKSSLLADSAWHSVKYSQDLERSDYTMPTWSWASVCGGVRFYRVSLLPSAKLVDVQYTAIGPSHVGGVANASIVLSGGTLNTGLKLAYKTNLVDQPGPNFYNLVPHIPKNYGHLKPLYWRFIPDFRLSLGERPVNLYDDFVIVFLWRDLEEGMWYGLVLRRVSGTEHERIGIADLTYLGPRFQDRPGSSSKQPRLATCEEWINSLPVEEFKII